MSNSKNDSSWSGFRKLWIIVAIILLLLLLLLMLAGYSPWGKKCEVQPKLVDNPQLLTRIAELEKENALIAGLKQENSMIAGLKSNIASLTKSSSLVAGLQAKVKALESIDVNAGSAELSERIQLLTSENSQIPVLKDNIVSLTKTAGLVGGLQAKVKALEAVDLNFEPPKLMERIGLLETQNATIAPLQSRIVELESSNAKSNDERNSALTATIAKLTSENEIIPSLQEKISGLEQTTGLIPSLRVKISDLEETNAIIPGLQEKIGVLETANGLIPGLQAKVKALEAVDVNFAKPQDNSELLAKVSNLEQVTKRIPRLHARISDLEIENEQIPVLREEISSLEVRNGLIPGLQAKVKALEAIDINFIKQSSAAALPPTAKLYFESGSSSFPTDLNQTMVDAIAYLKANPGSNANLSGFHDQFGNPESNRRLANRRSNTVRQILLDSGISNSRIFIASPSETTGTGVPKEARRVEVRVFN